MRLRYASSFLAAALSFFASTHAAMTATEVQQVIAQAASVASTLSPGSVIAVTDREGFVLGVWSILPNPPEDTVANAIAKAGTAAYLSSDQHAFTTRTAGFIVQQSFPPGLRNRPPGPLVGVNFSNLAFSDVNHFKRPPFTVRPNGRVVAGPAPLPVTGGLAGTPGGVPLYRAGRLIGGVGVAGDGDTAVNVQVSQRYDLDEAVALAGQFGFQPHRTILGTLILIDGIRLPYVETRVPGAFITPLLGGVVPGYSIQSSPPVQYPSATLGNVAGEIRQSIISDPITGNINGQPRLTAAEVQGILTRGAARAIATRAGIRPGGDRAARVFITVVNNPGTNGTPTVLGTFRMADATLFSWDVAVQKARTALYFSSEKYAFSTRTVGFLSQSLYPPGIEGTAPGLFLGLQEQFSMFPAPRNPLNGANVPQPPVFHSRVPNGITIFPGGFPLYRNGVLIGAVGVSGDGIDQDDLISVSASEGFLAPESIRADRYQIRNARLPFAKFPRNPGL
ncbi:MAG: GlcG/HbpS family heme-binding protein [Limisphaerales bacterium]